MIEPLIQIDATATAGIVRPMLARADPSERFKLRYIFPWNEDAQWLAGNFFLVLNHLGPETSTDGAQFEQR